MSYRRAYIRILNGYIIINSPSLVNEKVALGYFSCHTNITRTLIFVFGMLHYSYNLYFETRFSLGPIWERWVGWSSCPLLLCFS